MAVIGSSNNNHNSTYLNNERLSNFWAASSYLLKVYFATIYLIYRFLKSGITTKETTLVFLHLFYLPGLSALLFLNDFPDWSFQLYRSYTTAQITICGIFQIYSLHFSRSSYRTKSGTVIRQNIMFRCSY